VAVDEAEEAVEEAEVVEEAEEDVAVLAEVHAFFIENE